MTMIYALKRSFLHLLVIICFGTALNSPASQAGTVVHTTMDSQALQAPYPMTVYIPDREPSPGSVYPVVYLLHGSFGSENDWLANGNLKSTADHLIASGQIPPVLIVMPGSQSWWLNGYNEPAEHAFFEDLIPYIEANYPTARTRTGRLVAGLSAGGYGATRFALKYPELFGAAAALSPATYVPLPPKNSSAHRHPGKGVIIPPFGTITSPKISLSLFTSIAAITMNLISPTMPPPCLVNCAPFNLMKQSFAL